MTVQQDQRVGNGEGEITLKDHLQALEEVYVVECYRYYLSTSLELAQYSADEIQGLYNC